MDSENGIRVFVFLVMLAVMTVWEMLAPRRTWQGVGRGWQSIRWVSNLLVMLTGTLAVRLLFPFLGSAVAVIALERGWGFFNQVSVSPWIAVPVCLIVLDGLIYFQHRLFHVVPLLWRLHRMHHADTHIDVTTGVRFHPVEIVLSMAIKLAGVIVLGAPVLAVILFELVLNATSLFNHANIRVPVCVDRCLRLVLVTPDMHRIHHSWHGHETGSNFGFSIPWWDRMFGTYLAEPRDGHIGMTTGLRSFRDPSQARIDRLLLHPFVGDRTG